jgi:hypothetical protein
MWINPINDFLITIWGISSISSEVCTIMLIKVPSMISYYVWDDFRVGLNSVIFSSSILSNRFWDLIMVTVRMVMVAMVVLDVGEGWSNLISRWI